MKPLDTLVFDLDGTLIDSAPDIHLLTNEILVNYGRAPLDLPTVTSFVGYGATVLLERAFSATGPALPPAALAQATAAFRERYTTFPVVHTRPMPHVPEVLVQLARHCTLAVCTNKPEEPARAVLDALDFTRFFSVVVGGDTLPVRKPDPAPLRAAAAGARHWAFVGDTEVDGATAEAVGVPFFWFTRGYHHSVPTRFHASFSDWQELPSHVVGPVKDDP